MHVMMYDTPHSVETAGIFGFLAGIGVAMWILIVAITVLSLIGKWKMFSKAGVGGWESLIPIHSEVVALKLAGIETYWWFLNLIILFGIGPIVLAFWTNIELSKAFGKGVGFGILMTFFPYICFPILGFGKAEYIGNKTQNQ